MLLTNHTLTGVLLGLTIDNPVLLAPTAVASHLALDMTPHFGHKSLSGNFRSVRFLILGSADFALSIAVTITACIIWPERFVNILIGVVGAALPDLTYIPIIVFGWARLERWFSFYRPMIRFLGSIQWYEKPPGLITEIAWAMLMIWILHNYL